jgi:Flp pilus assembly protein TadB
MIGYTVFVAFLYARPIPRPLPLGQELVDETGAFLPEPTGQCLAVAIYILLVGIWWAIRQARKAKISEKQMISAQVSELVSAFKSVFRIRPTVFSALEEANRKMPPPVGTAVAHAVTTFYVTSMPQRAFNELRARIQDPYLDQFVYILERGEDARHEDIVNALNDLQLRLRRAREMRDQSEVNMTVISGQTRIIQMIAVFLVSVVGFAALLRVAYESPIGQATFIFIATIGVSTSWYIDRKSQQLKERVL